MKLPNEILEFAEKYAFAFDPRKNGYSKINLFDYQKKLLQQLETQKFTIIKKSRQVGLDVALAIYVSNFALKNPGKQILVISCNIDEALCFLNKVKAILLNAQAAILNMNQKNIYLRNKSTITVTGCSNNAGKGSRYDFIYMNEFEFNPNGKSVYESLFSTISCASESKMIISSTPRYKGSFFYKLWNNARKKESDFKRINITWKDVPNRDEEWYKKECLMLGNFPGAITTELDGNFIEKPKPKQEAINIRIIPEKKEQILKRMKQKNISSITDYIMELIDKDLKC
jgi:hypothetical protein